MPGDALRSQGAGRQLKNQRLPARSVATWRHVLHHHLAGREGVQCNWVGVPGDALRSQGAGRQLNTRTATGSLGPRCVWTWGLAMQFLTPLPPAKRALQEAFREGRFCAQVRHKQHICSEMTPHFRISSEGSALVPLSQPKGFQGTKTDPKGQPQGAWPPTRVDMESGGAVLDTVSAGASGAVADNFWEARFCAQEIKKRSVCLESDAQLSRMVRRESTGCRKPAKRIQGHQKRP